MILNCARPTTVPTISDNNEQTNNKACQTLAPLVSSLASSAPIPSGSGVSKAPGVKLCKVNSNTKIEILGITAIHVVTIVGTPSYTSGAQLWKGAEAILNKNPTVMITSPKVTPKPGPITLFSAAPVKSKKELSTLGTEIKLAMASRFVRPV